MNRLNIGVDLHLRYDSLKLGIFFKKRSQEAARNQSAVVLRANVELPWLPYKGLLPEMFPFSHPADLLLVPVHVLSHQNLKENRAFPYILDRV